MRQDFRRLNGRQVEREQENAYLVSDHQLQGLCTPKIVRLILNHATEQPYGPNLGRFGTLQPETSHTYAA